MKIKVVSGYVPIPNHPRMAHEYSALADKLFRYLKAPVRSFYSKLDQCWLWKHIEGLPYQVKSCEGDNPAKNSLAYHCVNHNKVEWLSIAAKEDADADTFIWMDYGIAHQIGVIPEVVNPFLKKVAKGDFAVPGCWGTTEAPISMSYPNWRFCGSLLIVPREHIEQLRHSVEWVVKGKIAANRCLEWETNTMARAERLKLISPRWYSANHDETQFTNYRAPHVSSSGEGLGAVGESRPGSKGLVLPTEAA